MPQKSRGWKICAKITNTILVVRSPILCLVYTFYFISKGAISQSETHKNCSIKTYQNNLKILSTTYMVLFLILSKMGRNNISHVFTPVNRKKNQLQSTCQKKCLSTGKLGKNIKKKFEKFRPWNGLKKKRKPKKIPPPPKKKNPPPPQKKMTPPSMAALRNFSLVCWVQKNSPSSL